MFSERSLVSSFPKNALLNYTKFDPLKFIKGSVFIGLHLRSSDQMLLNKLINIVNFRLTWLPNNLDPTSLVHLLAGLHMCNTKVA